MRLAASLWSDIRSHQRFGRLRRSEQYAYLIYIIMLRFIFDPAKEAENLRKHGVPFADAEGVFYDVLAIHASDPDAQGEERSMAVGLGSAGQLLVVIYTMRGEEVVRLISARGAARREARAYAG